MENKKKVILDCDPGHDDAFGIMLAVQHLDVLGITTIGGNCTLENVTRNAIKVLEVLGAADRIGVYPGHSCPMVAPLGHRTAVPWRDWSGRSPCCRSRRTPHRTSMRSTSSSTL